jgi:hypothetical protein
VLLLLPVSFGLSLSSMVLWKLLRLVPLKRECLLLASLVDWRFVRTEVKRKEQQQLLDLNEDQTEMRLVHHTAYCPDVMEASVAAWQIDADQEASAVRRSSDSKMAESGSLQN